MKSKKQERVGANCSNVLYIYIYIYIYMCVCVYNYVTVNKLAVIVVHRSSISHMFGRELFWKKCPSTIYWLLLVEAEIQKFFPFAVHVLSSSPARGYFIARGRDPTIWWELTRNVIGQVMSLLGRKRVPFYSHHPPHSEG